MNQHPSRNQTNSGKGIQSKAGKLGRAVIAFALVLVSTGSVLAGQGAQNATKVVDAVSSIGMPQIIFTGSTGTVGMDAHHTDELVFGASTFHSRECQKIGFEKSAFKIVREGDEIQFSAVNVSSRYGTLVWQGVIRDGIIEARYLWKKERMFWTIQREYWFSGEVSDVRR